jgi:hypothetical protein
LSERVNIALLWAFKLDNALAITETWHFKCHIATKAKSLDKYYSFGSEPEFMCPIVT